MKYFISYNKYHNTRSKIMKVVVIGAGSARFAQQLVGDFCLFPSLRGAEIVLVDTDPQRLELVTCFAKRYSHEMGNPVSFTSTTDRKAALQGASFVINTALAGGRGLMEADRAIWEAYGYHRGINVDVPHRQLTLMVEIAQEMADICPEAWLLQCGNPVTEGATLMYRATGFDRIIGICHGYLGYQRVVALLGKDPGLAECTAVGINHNVWATKFLFEGVDLYPAIEAWSQRTEPAHFEVWQGRNDDYMISRVAFDLYRQYGLWPVGDTARAINHMTWWYHTDAATKKFWYGPTGGWDSDEGGACNGAWLRQLLADMTSAVADQTSLITSKYPPKLSEWQVVPIIDSIANDRPTIQQVNVLNRGIMPQLPSDLFVEFPGVVSAAGVSAKSTYTFPSLLAHAILLPRATRAEMVMQAYLTRDPRFLLESMLIDHKTQSRDQAINALCAIMSAEQNADMASHYGTNMHHLHKIGAK